MQDLSIYLPGILLAYSAFFLSIMRPGPNILAILGTSMSIDRSSGIALAFGVALGSFTWASLTVVIGTFILSATIHSLYAVAFSTPLMVRTYGKARRGIQAVLGSFFGFAGIKLLSD